MWHQLMMRQVLTRLYFWILPHLPTVDRHGWNGSDRWRPGYSSHLRWAAGFGQWRISDAADKFGSQCVVVAIDAKRRADGSGWNIYKNGGRVDVGQDAVEWAVEAEKRGAGEILLTSMDGDGTKAGYDLELTKAVADAVEIPVIASGGAGNLEHFFEALTYAGAEAVLAASLFHYKELEIRQVKEYLRNRGISVRL